VQKKGVESMLHYLDDYLLVARTEEGCQEALHKLPAAPETVKSYLAAMRFGQISRGLGDPEMGKMPQLEYVIREMKRKTAAARRTRLPITPEILTKLRSVWDGNPKAFDAKLLWAASSLCFFGFLR